MAEVLFVRTSETTLTDEPPDRVAPPLATALRSWAQQNLSRYVYLGDCQRARQDRDAGKLCSLVEMLSGSTASVLFALTFTDGGIIATFRKDGSGWSPIEAVPFSLPIEVFPPEAATPIDAVRQYYQLLTQRDWPRAWQLLSAGYHAYRPYDLWVADFNVIPFIALTSVQQGTSPTHVIASAEATVITTAGPQDQQWITDWQLVQEGGTWKLDTGIQRDRRVR